MVVRTMGGALWRALSPSLYQWLGGSVWLIRTRRGWSLYARTQDGTELHWFPPAGTGRDTVAAQFLEALP